MLGRAALVLAIAASPALAQDDGGLRLTFGVEQRLEASENLALTTPGSGSLTAATTNLSFALISETRTQTLRLGLSGGLRFDSASEPQIFDHPSVDLFYSLTGANSALTLSANASRSLLGTAAPTVDNPDPRGSGSQTAYAASASLDLGQSGPLGLTLLANRHGTSFDGAAPGQFDTRSLDLSATAHLRFPVQGDVSLTASHSDFHESNADDLSRETSALTLGWAVALSPVLSLDSALGFERLDTVESAVLVDRTEGLVGHAALTWEVANGTAGLSIAQSNDPGAGRLTLTANRRLDLGAQTLSASLGATRQGDGPTALIGALAWSHDGTLGAINLDLGRTVASAGLGAEVTTDHLTLGLSRPLTPVSSLGLSLSASRIDDNSAARVNRMDVTASYSRDFGADWAMNLGATFQSRAVTATPRATSRLLFLSLSRNFNLRP